MSVDTVPGKAFATMASTPPPTRHRPGDDAPEEFRTGAGARDETSEAGAAQAGGGDPLALTAVRLTASAALLVGAGMHLRAALSLGLGGSLLAQSHLVLLAALPAALLGLLLLGRDSRLWLFAVGLAAIDLAAILASVYLPLPAAGPFPGLDEPVWLLTKAVSALADLTVITLWLIRQVAPPRA